MRFTTEAAGNSRDSYRLRVEITSFFLQISWKIQSPRFMKRRQAPSLFPRHQPGSHAQCTNQTNNSHRPPGRGRGGRL
jgi:hypothetical protein